MVSPIKPETKKVVEEILARAVQDIQFREKLILNPAEALKDYPLTADEKETVAGLKKAQLEEWGIDTRRHMAGVRDNGTKKTAS